MHLHAGPSFFVSGFCSAGFFFNESKLLEAWSLIDTEKGERERLIRGRNLLSGLKTSVVASVGLELRKRSQLDPTETNRRRKGIPCLQSSTSTTRIVRKGGLALRLRRHEVSNAREINKLRSIWPSSLFFFISG